MAATSIEWTEHTWNPVRGCSKCSEGCEHCYAIPVALRFSGPGLPYEGFAKSNPTNWTGRIELVPDKLFEPLSWQKPRTVFVNSMSDLFHELLPTESIDQVVAVMALSTRHTFQVLTKRADRLNQYLSDPALGGRIYKRITNWLDDGTHGPLGRSWDRCHTLAGQRTEGGQLHDSTRWKLPFPNVWFGVSIENQQRADERREALRAAPAAVKFVSYEPALGPVNWDGWEFVDQIISGGESGDDARPSHPEWHRATRDFCQAHSIPYFFKQWGEWLPGPQVGTRFSDDALTRFKVREVSTPTMQGGLCTNYCFRVGKSAAGRILDGQTWDEMPKVTA